MELRVGAAYTIFSGLVYCLQVTGHVPHSGNGQRIQAAMQFGAAGVNWLGVSNAPISGCLLEGCVLRVLLYAPRVLLHARAERLEWGMKF